MRGRTRVKICGITRTEDAVLAADLGADAVGFIFWPSSPRAITVDRARAIADDVPAFVTRVGVFVDASVEEVERVVEAVGLHAIQLHGSEDVAAFEGAGASLIRSVGVENDVDVANALALPATVTPLVDAIDREKKGGTGRRASWAHAAAVASGRRTILAGGLVPENVAEAVRVVEPWGVDVSSGVELKPGIKSHDKLRAFFDAIDRGRQETR